MLTRPEQKTTSPLSKMTSGRSITSCSTRLSSSTTPSRNARTGLSRTTTSISATAVRNRSTTRSFSKSAIRTIPPVALIWARLQLSFFGSLLRAFRREIRTCVCSMKSFILTKQSRTFTSTSFPLQRSRSVDFPQEYR